MENKYDFGNNIFDYDITGDLKGIFWDEKNKQKLKQDAIKYLKTLDEDEVGISIVACAILFHENGWLDEAIKKEAIKRIKTDSNIKRYINDKEIKEISKKLKQNQPEDKGNIHFVEEPPPFEFSIGEMYTVVVTDELSKVKEIVGKKIAFIIVDEYFLGDARRPVFMVKLVEEEASLDDIEKEDYLFTSKIKVEDMIVPPPFRITDDEIDNGWLKKYRFSMSMDDKEFSNLFVKIGTSKLSNFPKYEHISLSKNPSSLINPYSVFDRVGNSYIKHYL